MTRSSRVPKGSYEVLARLYREVLGVDHVGLDDDFFALGGDESTLPALAHAIYEWFGLPVSEATIRESPTVAALGAHLGRRRPRGSPLVIPLSTVKAGEAAPLFFVAGGGGPATQLHAIADAVTSRPVYGIQQRGLEERARPDWRAPPFARRALREVRAIQPEGPYFICGHSYGTLVAFEMANQLVDAGAEVGLLVLIDVGIPPWPSALRVQARGGSPRRAARDRVLRLKRTLRRAKLTTVGLVTRPGLHQYDAFYLLGMHIGRRYEPTVPCRAPTLVVRAAEVEYFPDPLKVLPDLGWSKVLSGPVTCVDAPGDHLTMIRRPYAATLAGLIEAAIGPDR